MKLRRDGNDVVYDTPEPYDKRVGRCLDRCGDLTKIRKLSIICVVGLAFSLHSVLNETRNPLRDWMGLLLFGLSSGVFLVFWLRLWLVGLAPVARPSAIDEVEKQKIHGAGGFATREEIDVAAHGRVTGHPAEAAAKR